MSTPEDRSTQPPDAGIPTRVGLVALVTLLAVDAIRASGPVLDRAFTVGTLPVAGAALGTYLIAPGVLAALALLVTRRRDGMPGGSTVLWAVGALGVARLATQLLSDQGRFVAGLLTAALAVTALVLTVCRAAGRTAGGRQAAIGIMLGVGVSVGVQTVLRTWDPLWRGGATGVVWAVLLVAAAVGLAVLTRHDPAEGRPRRTWALGPALALLVMVLANPAFVAAQSGTGLVLAAGVLVLAAGATVWVLLVPDVLTPLVRVLCAVALPVLIALAFLMPDPVALVAAGLAQIATGVVLAGSLSTRRPAPPGIARTAVATAGVGGILVLVLLVYLLDYDVPLGVDNAWVVVAGALLLAMSGLRRTTPGIDPATGEGPVAPPLRANALRMLVLPSVVLLLLGWWRPWAGAEPTANTEGDLRVVSWNLHYGVAPDTRVDLEQMAATIEAQQPDVVALQEVARGWVLGGGVDMATWLADRLGMHVAFAPAADRQFGNVLLSRTPLTDIQVIDLPYGEGPQERSALTARVQTADGDWVRVTTVHVQHRDENTATRLEQLDALSAALPDDGPSILAGDFNAEPGWPEPEQLLSQGWISAIDDAGDPQVLTFPSVDPQVRIDWVFGQQVSFTGAEVLDDASSDHRALVARAQVD
ncbi:endonuclease/exonuclease/phosphatase family protein [Cellulomonas sp. NPDC089187]|uniref:endonuclease/exonuclease/phosphatase family protein n=1 Tax=Cellulomonas sp. NPDC089187 TaxID=3154970 RepID=UPI003429B5B6